MGNYAKIELAGKEVVQLEVVIAHIFFSENDFKIHCILQAYYRDSPTILQQEPNTKNTKNTKRNPCYHDSYIYKTRRSETDVVAIENHNAVENTGILKQF